MSSETTATTAEDFEETMTNATPNELKQVSAWLQECGRVDAQPCEMDDDKPPISLDKPPFPLEVKRLGRRQPAPLNLGRPWLFKITLKA